MPALFHVGTVGRNIRHGHIFSCFNSFTGLQTLKFTINLHSARILNLSCFYEQFVLTCYPILTYMSSSLRDEAYPQPLHL